ncbi:hypothetical protein BATDEDRAFT_88732 [Batrachochytrium dendrobatidis JAM81]|uniref:Tyrosinase copper-binding domain-containing protein n=2 Tax=Batrachochytrium dendrobatidis TaxID=109871 RepID=F4P2Z0_BATDJ|nr:uncharacterized protein BATDEDRAFT_88732 [Batrachochytrium dendrobatidis JAM81]EGF80521.1 hypothetical protein BATDEDRAFT_88732 [Batrachochytrium dendrobatidis JAM81]|eukprot:XP_006679307.1 hypothetical protein BATDEDRAFT_88732 [Batrachochytrium dendrobatidis JAM81]
MSVAADSRCTNPTVRKEFRELSENERQAYISAVVCLHNSPSKIAGVGSTSRFDDVARTHLMVLGAAHASATFLPWHRALIHAYTVVMKEDCGYTGPMVYWDWSVDSQALEQSPLWSPSYFGGDGDPKNSYCISTGQFVNITTTFSRKSCITRRLGGLDNLGSSFSPELIRLIITTNKSFPNMHGNIEWGPHANIHEGIGGTMADVSLSANDPIFMLHHCNVDRLWWMWQQYNPNTALTYSGTLSNGSIASVTQIMDMFNLLNVTWTVEDVLNSTKGSPLCYVYSNSIAGGVDVQSVSIAPLPTSVSTTPLPTSVSTTPLPTSVLASTTTLPISSNVIISTPPVILTSTYSVPVVPVSTTYTSPSLASKTNDPNAKGAVKNSAWEINHESLMIAALVPLAHFWL